MPVMPCIENGKLGFKWGEHGNKCYTSNVQINSLRSVMDAWDKAARQGRAIKAHGGATLKASSIKRIFGANPDNMLLDKSYSTKLNKLWPDEGITNLFSDSVEREVASGIDSCELPDSSYYLAVDTIKSYTGVYDGVAGVFKTIEGDLTPYELGRKVCVNRMRELLLREIPAIEYSQPGSLFDHAQFKFTVGGKLDQLLSDPSMTYLKAIQGLLALTDSLYRDRRLGPFSF